jgi:hypothetical protein
MFCLSSIGSVGNMVAEYVAAKEKIKPVHVAYRGAAPRSSISWRGM